MIIITIVSPWFAILSMAMHYKHDYALLLWMEKILHHLIDIYFIHVYPVVSRTSTILVVVYDFATISTVVSPQLPSGCNCWRPARDEPVLDFSCEEGWGLTFKSHLATYTSMFQTCDFLDSCGFVVDGQCLSSFDGIIIFAFLVDVWRCTPLCNNKLIAIFLVLYPHHMFPCSPCFSFNPWFLFMANHHQNSSLLKVPKISCHILGYSWSYPSLSILIHFSVDVSPLLNHVSSFSHVTYPPVIKHGKGQYTIYQWCSY